MNVMFENQALVGSSNKKSLSYKKTKIPTMPPSEPAETTALSGPESVTNGSSDGGGQ